MRRLTLLTLFGATLAASTLVAQDAPQPRGRPGIGGGPPSGGTPQGMSHDDDEMMQARRGGMPGRGAMGDPASFMLAHTGELRLTDAQVVKLAAIARRADDRHRAMRASMDSMRPPMGAMRAPMTRDSAGREQMRRRVTEMQTQMRQRGERMMEQVRVERRDAIAVLTPDQQAQAWEMIQARPRGPGFARFSPGMGARGFGGGRSFGPGGPSTRRSGPQGGPRRPRRNDDEDDGAGEGEGI